MRTLVPTSKLTVYMAILQRLPLSSPLTLTYDSDIYPERSTFAVSTLSNRL